MIKLLPRYVRYTINAHRFCKKLIQKNVYKLKFNMALLLYFFCCFKYKNKKYFLRIKKNDFLLKVTCLN